MSPQLNVHQQYVVQSRGSVYNYNFITNPCSESISIQSLMNQMQFLIFIPGISSTLQAPSSYWRCYSASQPWRGRASRWGDKLNKLRSLTAGSAHRRRSFLPLLAYLRKRETFTLTSQLKKHHTCRKQDWCVATTYSRKFTIEQSRRHPLKS